MKERIEELRGLIEAKEAEIDALWKNEDGTEKRGFTNADEEKKFDTLYSELEKLTTELRQAVKIENQKGLRAMSHGFQVSNQEVASSGFSVKEERQIQNYSFMRALKAAAEQKELDGFEGEMQKEAEKEERSAGVPFSATGRNQFKVPSLVLNYRAITATGTTSTTGDQGGVNVQTSILGNVQSLDSQLALVRAGAEFITGVVGNYDFTVESDNFRPDWLTETGSTSNKNLTFTKKTLSPKRLAGHVLETRQILLQTDPSFERRIQQKIINGTALAIDLAGINGSGSSNQPTGALNTSNVVSVVGGTNGATITRDHLAALVNGPGKADYQGLNYKFLTNYAVRETLMKTKTDAGSGKFVWEEGGSTLLGYDTVLSTLVPNNLTKGTASGVCSAVLFGDFSQLKIAQWAGITVLVDPYTMASDGQIKLVVETFADCLLLQPKAIAVMKDALTA